MISYPPTDATLQGRRGLPSRPVGVFYSQAMAILSLVYLHSWGQTNNLTALQVLIERGWWLSPIGKNNFYNGHRFPVVWTLCNQDGVVFEDRKQHRGLCMQRFYHER